MLAFSFVDLSFSVSQRISSPHFFSLSGASARLSFSQLDDFPQRGTALALLQVHAEAGQLLPSRQRLHQGGALGQLLVIEAQEGADHIRQWQATV